MAGLQVATSRCERIMPKIKTALKLVRHPESIPGVLVHRVMSHRSLRGILYRYVDWRDQRYSKRSDFAHVPPAALRFRVHGDLSLHSFLETGRQCQQDIKNALTKVGKDLDSFQHILDFGCGCGRTLIWFSSNAKPSCLYGTDIDAEAIAWCRGYLNFAKFDTNRPLPPLNYPAETFDLTYAISVFTHLNEDYQLRWLSELQRVTKPKGYVLLTIHGFYYWSNLLAPQIEEIKRAGFLFIESPKSMQGIFPEWYQTTYHSQEYVLSKYSKYFNVLDYIPTGLDQCQDVIVLQKR